MHFYCCPYQETGEVLTSDDWMGRRHLRTQHFFTQGLRQGFSRRGPRLVSPILRYCVECPNFEEPGMLSDKSCKLEVSALWFLHNIPFILCVGRGVLSVETSDRREGLAARKTMF
jgi:hypothetical protein